jgi:uncharacterized membrane protein YkoI
MGCAMLVAGALAPAPDAAAAVDGKEGQETKLRLDQVPAAVAETLRKESGGTLADDAEVERETKKGRTVYEADIVVDGQKYEVKVDAAGKLLYKKAVDKDDDDDGHEEQGHR